MAYNVKVVSKDLDHFLAVISAKGGRFKERLAQEGPVMGQAVAETIMNAIATQMPNDRIARFMSNRTKIDVISSESQVTLVIGGLTEGEVPPDRRARSDGTIPQVSSPDVNLWLTHEFGVPSDGSYSTEEYEKDVGGVKVVRKGTAYGHGSPYVGEIRKIVKSITGQLEGVLRGFGAIIGTQIAGEIIETASRGRVQIDPRAIPALQRAGISEAFLAGLKVIKVNVSKRGQINLIGRSQAGAGRFISGGGRVPTTINR